MEVVTGVEVVVVTDVELVVVVAGEVMMEAEPDEVACVGEAEVDVSIDDDGEVEDRVRVGTPLTLTPHSPQ